MQILMIGATGWIGGAIVDELLSANHQVLGLVRSESSGQELRAKGVAAVVGSMDEPQSLLPLTRSADGVVVASAASADATIATLKSLVEGLQGTQKPLVYISGSSLYGDIANQEAVSEAVFEQHLDSAAMSQSPERLVFQAFDQNVQGLIIVGAGILYGRNGGGTPKFWLEDAEKRKVAWYIGDGTQRWSAVHVEDLARLTVLALEQKPTSRIFNAVAEAITMEEAAEIVAEAVQASGGAHSVSQAEAKNEWGEFWGESLAVNLWLSSARAESELGWKWSASSFRDDMVRGSYQTRSK